MEMFKLVKNDEKYYDFIRELRNANHNDGFVEDVNITTEQQKEYMKKHKDNYYVCLYNNDPVGFVGSIDGDIRVAVNPSYFGKGIGQFMIQELMKIFPESYAKIKVDNKTSKKLFEKCGFKEKYIIMELDNES
jgi:RimJ/RimL family protein N-acetyltransferase